MSTDAGLLVRPASGRGAPIPRIVAAAAWILMLGLVIGSSLLWLIDGQKRLPISYAHGAVGVVGVAACAVVFTSLGAMLSSRLSRNPIGWMILAIGLMFAFLTPVNLAIQRAFEVARPFPLPTLVGAWLMSSIMTPLIACIVLTVCMIFPNGCFLPGRWWLGGVVASTAALLLAVTSALEPSGLIWYPTVPNPAGLAGSFAPLIAALRIGALVELIAGGVVAAAAVWIRYRRADFPVQRQLRWIVVGAATMAAGLLPLVVIRYTLQVGESTGEVIAGLAAAAMCAFPVTIALAIIRQHLFDIDQLISRTLVYVPLMGICAGLYTASLTLFQRIFVSLTNDTSDAAVVFSALILASVFAPLRSALEVHVNRHFRPPEPDRVRDHVADGSRALGEPIPSASTQKPGPAAARRETGRVTDPAARLADTDIRVLIADLEAGLDDLRRLEAQRRGSGEPATADGAPPVPRETKRSPRTTPTPDATPCSTVIMPGMPRPTDRAGAE